MESTPDDGVHGIATVLSSWGANHPTLAVPRRRRSRARAHSKQKTLHAAALGDSTGRVWVPRNSPACRVQHRARRSNSAMAEC